MPTGDLRGGVFYSILTLMMDSYYQSNNFQVIRKKDRRDSTSMPKKGVGRLIFFLFGCFYLVKEGKNISHKCFIL